MQVLVYLGASFLPEIHHDIFVWETTKLETVRANWIILHPCSSMGQHKHCLGLNKCHLTLCHIHLAQVTVSRNP